MKKSLVTLVATAAFMLVGCSSTTKTQASFEKYKQDYFANPPATAAALSERVDKAWETMIDEPSSLNDQIYLFLKKEQGREQSASLKIEEVSRHFAVNWGNTGRGGAALREPAYIHTLGGIKSNERLPRNRPPAQELVLIDLTASYTLNNLQAGKGYSHYELSRWERYCNYGIGMDKRDWEFIAKEGLHNMPDQLRVRCNHPK